MRTGSAVFWSLTPQGAFPSSRIQVVEAKTDRREKHSGLICPESAAEEIKREAQLAALREKTNRELAQYVRSKMNLAVHLACQAEHERRSGRWEAAEEYQRRWEAAFGEAKRLLPLVRRSGVGLYEDPKPTGPRPRRKPR